MGFFGLGLLGESVEVEEFESVDELNDCSGVDIVATVDDATLPFTKPDADANRVVTSATVKRNHATQGAGIADELSKGNKVRLIDIDELIVVATRKKFFQKRRLVVDMSN